MAQLARITYVKQAALNGTIPFFFRAGEVKELLAEIDLRKSDGELYRGSVDVMLSNATLRGPDHVTKNRNSKFLKRFRDSSGELVHYVAAGQVEEGALGEGD